jgi:hypothetical protein
VVKDQQNQHILASFQITLVLQLVKSQSIDQVMSAAMDVEPETPLFCWQGERDSMGFAYGSCVEY